MFGVDFKIISSGKKLTLVSGRHLHPWKVFPKKLLRFAVRLIWVIIFLRGKFQEDESCKGTA